LLNPVLAMGRKARAIRADREFYKRLSRAKSPDDRMAVIKESMRTQPRPKRKRSAWLTRAMNSTR
jgi:hypothetical protein